MKKAALLAVTLAALLAGCGGSGHAPATTRTFCSGLTDKCVKVTPAATLPRSLTTAGECKIPDVSNWQGHVNWALAKPHVCGGIFKGGEALTPDAFAADNNSQLTALHMWHAMYWYVRNVGCTAEANAIIAEAHRLHVQIVENDLESASDNVGYGACLPALEKKAGLTAGDYTSPGTWSSGDGGFGAVPLWQAEYGPTLHPLWHPVVLWQCTDGHFGCVTNVPGIGVDDVSLDLGITKLGPQPGPTGPVCFGGHRQHTTLCDRVRTQDAVRGRTVKRENGYIAVSRHNVATFQGRLTVEQRNLAAIGGALRILRGIGQRDALLGRLFQRYESEVKLTQPRLVAAQRRLALEQHKATVTQAALSASLKRYGFRG